MNGRHLLAWDRALEANAVVGIERIDDEGRIMFTLSTIGNDGEPAYDIALVDVIDGDEAEAYDRICALKDLFEGRSFDE